ncbi:MAG TPA: mandelate racemase/muconate lactonizing enzyme family protein [Patescibacteria group bacterium]|nr:mandelate racemase/muconate lactonizing enzyme family protein [Patescibacteria group bacterium]
MKITKIEIIPVDVPRKKVLTIARYGNLGGGGVFEFVLTRVHTDEGVTGVGEAPPLPPLSPESQPVVTDVIRRWVAPNVMGMDPFEIEAIWDKMDFYAPTYPMAKAAIDMALWDIMGKALDMPVHRLLGGSPPVKIPNVGLIGIDEPEAVADTAENLVSMGYRGIRLKIAPGRDVGCVEAVRETIGDDVSLRVDCNQGYRVAEAVKMIRAIEAFDVELVEQPTVWWDFSSLAEVAMAVDTPIMPHESLYLQSDVKNLIDAGAVGVLGLKTYRPWGGITGARRILEMARVMNIPCLFHDDLELSVSLAAATQIITAYRGVITHKSELSGYPEWMTDDVTTEPVKFEGGYVHVPDGLGLGVELDESKVEEYTRGIITLQ